MFLSRQHLRILPSQRRLPWRPLFLFHVALCRFSPIVRNRLGGHDAYHVSCHSDRRQTKKGIWMEDIGWTAFPLRGRGVCCHGNNCEFHRQDPRLGHPQAFLDKTANIGCQAYLYDNDDRFFPGWKLDISWFFCTISWSVLMLLGTGITATALLLPSEGGYELIPGDDWGRVRDQDD